MTWSVIFYETARGEKPVEEFIQSLDVKAKDKVARTLDHLEEFGTHLGPPHMKKLSGTSLWGAANFGK